MTGTKINEMKDPKTGNGQTTIQAIRLPGSTESRAYTNKIYAYVTVRTSLERRPDSAEKDLYPRFAFRIEGMV
jgi:hypothetical protein